MIPLLMKMEVIQKLFCRTSLFFGDIESFSSPANLSESSNANVETLINSGNDTESSPDEQGFFHEPVVACATPLRLDVFETNGVEDARYDET